MSTPLTDNFWNSLPLGRGVMLVNRDSNGLAAFDKPCGALSHPNEPGDESRSLLVARYFPEEECFEWSSDGDARRLWLLNRLDSATSGVILATSDGDLAAEVRGQFKRKQVRKVYQALVFGAPRQPIELWRDRLAIESRGGMIRTAPAAGNVPAECRMTVVRSSVRLARVSLLKLEPRTGRSHQLRVQCAKRGLPIIGDRTYGDFAANREFARATAIKRMLLHSLETMFDYEWRGARYSFAAQAPLPSEFLEYL